MSKMATAEVALIDIFSKVKVFTCSTRHRHFFCSFKTQRAYVYTFFALFYTFFALPKHNVLRSKKQNVLQTCKKNSKTE